MAHDELVEEAVTSTFPGPDNNDILELSHALPEVMAQFEDETNGWFMVEKVHLYRDRVGVTASFRWTMERWAAMRMDRVLLNSGWSLDHHLLADWREIEDDEIQARYTKEIHGVPVHANFLVEMTDRVFEALEDGESIRHEQKPEKDRVNEIIERIS